MRLYDPQLLRLLAFLTKRQAWLLPRDVAKGFRINDKPITSRTVQRWFAFLREHGGFVYYPYPKANRLGLQDVLVRVHGLRNPAILGVLPFAASFQVEVGLGDGQRFVNQSHWVPGTEIRAFEEYWEAARDLGLVERVDLLRAKNTHTIFSPFHEIINPDGRVKIEGTLDNSHFAALIRRNLRERFEVRLSELIADSPLVIPIVIEHIWRHYSSQHVWRAIQLAGTEHIQKFGRSLLRKAESPGAALRLVQLQWSRLMEHYDDVFLQPRVGFNWLSLQDCSFASFLIRAESEGMIEAALRASERSVVTALKPGIGPEGWCHVTCLIPSHELLPLLRVVDEFHRDGEPPVVSLQDWDATMALFQPSYCRVDWRLFDPETLSWRFEGEAYVDALKDLKPGPPK